VQLTGDGGGKVPTLARSLHGRNRVARTLINWLHRITRAPGVSLRPVEINGGPGALLLDAQQRLIGVWALDIRGGQITSISSVVNPDKLTHLGAVGDFRSFVRCRDDASTCFPAARAAVRGRAPRGTGPLPELHPDEQRYRLSVVARTMFAGRVGSRQAETILKRIGESSAMMDGRKQG
jgi:hypothetical protein